MRKLLVIGDVHGLVPAYVAKVKSYVRSGGEQTLQVGDFGFKEDYDRRDLYFKESEILDPEKHLFIGGNHDDYDNRPDFMLDDFGSLQDAFGIENGFYVRGARSIDRDQRTEGVDWWRDEELSYARAKEALEAYTKQKPRVMITHDVPDVAARNIFKRKEVTGSTTKNLLSEAFERHQPELWIFGHWHFSKDEVVEGTRFICLDELETFEINEQ
jgi:predicted phosphodiesterase